MRINQLAATSAACVLTSASFLHAQGFIGHYAHDRWTSTGILGGTTVIRPAVRIESAGHCVSGDSVSYFHDVLSPFTVGQTFDAVQRFLVRGSAANVQYALSSTGLLGLPNVIVPNNAAYTRTDTATASATIPSTTFDVIASADGGGTVSASATIDLVNFGPGRARPMPVGALTNFPGGVPSQFLPSSEELYLGYDVILGGGGVTSRSATFTAIAPCTGLATFDWEYNGFHAFFGAFASLVASSDLTCGAITQTLVPNSSVSNEFTFSGTAVTLPIEAGQPFGLTVTGRNFDSDSRILGTIRLFNFKACVPPLQLQCPGDADGNRVVNFADITSVLTNFNMMCP